MAVYAKKKKPFILRFFGAIFLIVFIVALMMGALWCYLYFAKKVNYISVIGQLSALNVEVNESELAPHAPSASDLISIKTNMQNFSSASTGIEITDKEFCAYLNDQIANGKITLNFAGSEQKAQDVFLQVLQVEFKEPEQTGEVLTNINITFKFSTESYKQKLSTFPLSLVSNKIPETLYVSASGEILGTANDDYSYSIRPTEIKLNNLGLAESKNVIDCLDLVIKCGNAETLNTQILQVFCDELLGNQESASIFNQLSSKIAVGNETSYKFLDGKLKIDVDVAKYEVKVVQIVGTSESTEAGNITGTGTEFLYGNTAALTVNENQGFHFLGWYDAGGQLLSENTTYVVENITSDLTFYAHFSSDTYDVDLFVDGKKVTSFKGLANTELTLDTINAQLPEYDLTGYTMNWYTNPELTTLYTPSALNSKLTLYGTMTYFMDNMLFMPYLDEFNDATKNNSIMTFESEDELIAWVDYVVFYTVSRTGESPKNKPKFELVYKDNVTLDYIAQFPNIWHNKINYQTVFFKITSALYEIGPKTYGSIYIDPEDPESYDVTEMATKTSGQTKTMQYNNALAIQNLSPRTQNVFPIDKVEKTVPNITNTEQLVRVLEQGYKPLCVAGSTADQIYNEAKKVLKEICNDQMTDVQKLQAIYEWLILNVQYDHAVLPVGENAKETRLYSAWFAEGVFNHGIAVCEGYAKSALILARIEGIPAVVVTGAIHAWNKVQVDGKWYEFDATHGDESNGTTYTKFLFDSASRTSYPAQEYSGLNGDINLKCDTKYNFYTNAKYSFNNQEFDLFINTQQELELMLSYIKANTVSTKQYSFEFASDLTNIMSVFNTAKNKVGLTTTSPNYYSVDYYGNKVYRLIVN